jgi:hypothetical protein
MSDTRAAIRELRSLSEKRTLGTLTEPEHARWMALRRQLGLPIDVPAPAASPAPPPGMELAAGEAEAPVTSPAPEAPSEASWAGPALDAPHGPTATSWMGPALHAPAFSELARETPTDPGLDEPPPVPFDEAPAARPLPEVEGGDVSGRADEQVPLAPAADFISYARQGTEAIELPPASADPVDVIQRGLADLAASTGSLPLTTPVAMPNGEKAGRIHFPPSSQVASPRALEETGEPANLEFRSGSLAGAPSEENSLEGVLPAPPAPVPDQSTLPPEHVLPEEAVAPEAPALEAAPPTEGGPDEGVLPEAPAPLGLEAAPPAEGPFPDEGVLPEPPAPLPLENPLPPSDSAAGPLQLGMPLANPAPAEAPAPLPVSTWEPGAERPPVLAVEEFGHGGASLNGGNLDPWPEAPRVADEVVETVGDEDLLEPTPLPAFPPQTPAGSGGIRGFQFPRPPGAMVVPVPPTSQNIPRTRTRDGGLSPPTSTVSPAAPVARYQTPVPPRAAAPSTPQPAARLQTPLPPSAVAPTTPQPPARLQTPVAASAVAPATPPARLQTPLAASAVAPAAPQSPTRLQTPVAASAVAPPTAQPSARLQRPTTPVAASTPQPLARLQTPAAAAAVTRPGQPQTGAPLKAPTPRPAPVAVAPPALQPRQPPVEEGTLPVLELVDEVEAPPKLLPQRPPPVSTPTPAEGTGGFGPPRNLNPGFVEGDHRVVVHTLEGQVHRGTVHDLDLLDDALSVAQPDGRSVRVPTRRVKAVFFVLAPGAQPPKPRGERVQVTFRDGRQVVGYSEDHAAGEPGFFVVLSDARTNTARVYVYRGGIQSITAG